MHQEWFSVSSDTASRVQAQITKRRRVLAVGTTSVRALESAVVEGVVQPIQGETQIFIYPGYEFQVVNALLTNFHLPGSTLLMLISALAGKDLIQSAYQAAIDEEYRFFSYGDAMLIL
jgi:S-adenosylmethionine:tRNA ribosyltransferase-isomerase